MLYARELEDETNERIDRLTTGPIVLGVHSGAGMVSESRAKARFAKADRAWIAYRDVEAAYEAGPESGGPLYTVQTGLGEVRDPYAVTCTGQDSTNRQKQNI